MAVIMWSSGSPARLKVIAATRHMKPQMARTRAEPLMMRTRETRPGLGDVGCDINHSRRLPLHDQRFVDVDADAVHSPSASWTYCRPSTSRNTSRTMPSVNGTEAIGRSGINASIPDGQVKWKEKKVIKVGC